MWSRTRNSLLDIQHAAYRRRLKRALEAESTDQLTNLLGRIMPPGTPVVDSSDPVVLVTLHKVRLANPEVDLPYRVASANWLSERGLTDFEGSNPLDTLNQIMTKRRP